MAEAILANDDITVLGGPAEISLDVDFGPEGERGSLIFYGNGKPDTFTPPGSLELKVYDTYINVSAADNEYQFMYEYLPADGGGFNWTKVLKLVPNMYSYNQTITFTSGESELIELPLAAFVPIDPENPSILLGTYTAGDFNIQTNIINNSNPVSHAVSVDSIPTSGEQLLPIRINAIEYTSGSWQPLSGTKTVHLFITIKNNLA